MANKTVYPYGTDGELPSSIGLVNDLTTGGSDKALAAQQGKVLGDYLFGNWNQVDLSGVTVSNYGLGAGTSTSNNWTANGKHLVVPVTPGETIKISVTSSQTNGGWYGFFTNAYTEPTAKTDTVPYVTGTSRVWLDISTGELPLTVPSSAAYICLCPRDGDSHDCSWSMSRFVDAGIEDDYLATDSDALYATVYNDVDIDSITVSDYTMKASGWGKTSGAGKHIVIPVSAGENIKIRATGSSGDGNYRAFLTSSYVVPSADGQTIPYVSGTTRVWQYDYNGWVDLVAPNNAAYLCLVVENGDGDTTSWQVKTSSKVPLASAIEDYTIKKTDIVNNLSDGGADVPLSAEQGKVLNEKVSGDSIPSGMTKYQYKGVGINLYEPTTHYVAFRKISSITNAQGAACFGNYLFCFVANNTSCKIVNLQTNSVVTTVTISPGFVSNAHANTVNFGAEYYDENDEFPLIYVSTGYASDGYSGAIVYRIQHSNDTWSLTIVQTLKFPGTGWTEFITADDACYLCYTDERIIYRFAMPKLSAGESVIFDRNAALNAYQFTPQPASFNGSQNQGRIYRNGKIYVASGVPSRSQKCFLMVLNLATSTRETVIDFTDIGLTAEPEAVFFWNERLYVIFNTGGGIYEFYFE